MLRRLASFSERCPKSAAKVILALAIALVVTVMGILVAIVDMGDLLGSPYPSETTVLGWLDGSIVWTADDTVIFKDGGGYVVFKDTTDPSSLYTEYDGWGRNYSCMRFSWEQTGGRTFGDVANDSEQQMLNLGVPITTEIYVGGTFVDGLAVDFSLVVTDLRGNGAFDQGDQIAFKASPGTGASIYCEDEVYTLALIYIDSAHVWGREFSFAFHDEEFHSWTSRALAWDQPWWEY